MGLADFFGKRTKFGGGGQIRRLRGLLGREIWPRPNDIVLDGDPAPAQPPLIFGPCLLWPHGWLNEDATLYRVVCLGPYPPKGINVPNFQPMSVVANWPNGWMDQDAMHLVRRWLADLVDIVHNYSIHVRYI